MELVYGIDEIDKTAEMFLKSAKHKKVIAFSGEMGAGKTTFIHAVCRRMGVKGTLGSPTFSIINEYGSDQGPVYHIDLYRCKNEEEAIRAGVEECLYSGHTCMVEWPSRAEGIFPPGTFRVSMYAIDDHRRKITGG